MKPHTLAIASLLLVMPGCAESTPDQRAHSATSTAAAFPIRNTLNPKPDHRKVAYGELPAGARSVAVLPLRLPPHDHPDILDAATHTLVRNGSEWVALWAENAPGSQPPEVDFRSASIIVTRGSRPAPSPWAYTVANATHVVLPVADEAPATDTTVLGFYAISTAGGPILTVDLQHHVR